MPTQPLDTRLHGHLTRIYGESIATEVLPRLLGIVAEFRRQQPQLATQPGRLFDETDVVLIAYGDQVREPGRPTLATLREFLAEHTGPEITGVHLLPHHPASSDDGFAVIDYGAVDPTLGDWSHVAALAADYRLMLDAVVNHTSASHQWYLRSQAGDPTYADYYHYLDQSVDLGSVTRPRTSPLLSEGWGADERRRWVWTTFSADQVDLNYANPQVLLTVTEVLLSYLARGAGILRLDAVAFLWKQLGTACIHLPQTHEIVRLWRTVVDAVAPGTLLITETNVPHQENVSYFGDGDNEAHLVYQFPLAPLTLAAFQSGDATALTRWAGAVSAPGERATFFNFLGCHDGIGLRPLEGILPDAQVARLCAAVEQQGGRISYRAGPDGSPRPYELNISYFDALNPPTAGESRDRQVARFLAAQSILLSLAGVPAIYFHALFGSRSWPAGADHLGQPRVINRQRYARSVLAAELAEPASLRRQVLQGLRQRIRLRTGQPAFHPTAPQSVVDGGPGYFAVQRTAADGSGSVVCIHDLSGQPGRFRATLSDRLPAGGRLVDLADGSEYVAEPDGTLDVAMAPYGVRWLRTR